MYTTQIGKLIEINRYPVKSFSGETLDTVQLAAYGLLGDRGHAFVNKEKTGWDRYITARKIPAMIGYHAQLVSSQGEHKLTVSIKSPKGVNYNWDEQLRQEIQQYSKTSIAMEQFDLNANNLLGVDDASILIITDRSIERLQELYGKRLDHRRFRANFYITLEEGINEDELIGRRLIIGDSELTIKYPCERCTMITIDPDTLEKDVTLLKLINENMNLKFGLYADVTKVGTVTINDQVYLVN
ncbi:MOSC domain-containing protein [Paenibacillus endoradicis]|uniref:MOSC domain-containing protein n=1 Tax=Paenibacillus endoradicis TaxID=2972487 RepID=UPI0021592C00|nr:MOSC N-terminal beta barrel domain-containing protein [Paenibacillus endoradicis]MCR8656626.1 MOSC domain-containing protein [Paenibacillus endoradicis]